MALLKINVGTAVNSENILIIFKKIFKNT